MGQKFDKVKSHFKENKKVYIAAGIGVVAGAATVLILTPRGIQIVDALKVQVNSPTTNNVVQVIMSRPGPKAFVVQCKETQTVWPSIRAAAKELNIPEGQIRANIKGLKDTVDGLHFEKIAEV